MSALEDDRFATTEVPEEDLAEGAFRGGAGKVSGDGEIVERSDERERSVATAISVSWRGAKREMERGGAKVGGEGRWEKGWKRRHGRISVVKWGAG